MLRRYAKALAYILTFAVILSTVLAGWIAYFGTRVEPAKADCIIVLGCGLYGSTPSPFLLARLDEGIRLYREGYAGKIIVSGDQGPGEDITEAEAMRRYLLDHEISAEDIVMEDTSTSTRANLANSQAKMAESGLSSAIIVSNAYHLARCSVIARRLGLDATFSGVRLPQFKQIEMAGFLREIPATVWALIEWPGGLR